MESSANEGFGSQASNRIFDVLGLVGKLSKNAIFWWWIGASDLLVLEISTLERRG